MSNKMSAETERLLAEVMNVDALRHKLALLNIEAQHRLGWYHSHYNPAQPRVPAGDPHGGQWTRTGGGGARGWLTGAPAEAVHVGGLRGLKIVRPSSLPIRY